MNRSDGIAKSRLSLAGSYRALPALLSLLLLPPLSARADDLIGLYKLARQRDPAIQEARLTNLATRETLKQAYSGLLPTLVFGTGYDYTWQKILNSDNFL